MVALCSDAGPLNTSLLKLLGVSAEVSKGSTNILGIPDYKINNSFPNPFNFSTSIKIFQDFSHIFKRFRCQFEKTDIILSAITRARFVEQYDLSPADDYCSFHWIRELHKSESEEIYQNGAALSMTTLSNSDIWPSGFQKMRLKYTTRVFSDNVSSAIMAYLCKDKSFSGAHATSILISEASRWYKTVNNYHSNLASFISDESKLKEFKEIVVNFALMVVLAKFVTTKYKEDFPENYHFPRSAVKPIQASTALSSASLLEIVDELKLTGVKVFYSSNTGQDQLESLFGQLRADGFGNPSPRQVLQLIATRVLTFHNMCNKNFEFFTPEDSIELSLSNNFNDKDR